MYEPKSPPKVGPSSGTNLDHFKVSIIFSKEPGITRP